MTHLATSRASGPQGQTFSKRTSASWRTGRKPCAQGEIECWPIGVTGVPASQPSRGAELLEAFRTHESHRPRTLTWTSVLDRVTPKWDCEPLTECENPVIEGAWFSSPGLPPEKFR